MEMGMFDEMYKKPIPQFVQTLIGFILIIGVPHLGQFLESSGMSELHLGHFMY